MVTLGKSPREEIRQLSGEELNKYLEFAKDGTIGKELALGEFNRRQLKSHQGFTFASWIAVVAIIVAAILAALLAIK
jgi:hypothetical protein